LAVKKTKRKSTNDASELLDRRFGVGADAEAQHDEFREQADVAEMLYAARTAAGMTQKQLAEAAGTTQQVISQLEDADYQGHSLSMLRRIAAALGRRVEIRLVPNAPEKAAG
jgi:ribosome-binding protein aMBF1 (putative translation factor)